MNTTKSLPALAIAFASTFLFCGTASSQSLTVDNNLGQMVRKYLDQRAYHQIAERQNEIAAIQNKGAVQKRQVYIRKTILKEIGGFPDRTPLHAKITGTVDRPDYTIEKLVYQSLPHFYVTADVYVPKNAHKPYPAVLGVAGHSPDGKEFSNYQTVWISLVKRGFLVLAIDPLGQGERIQHLDPKTHRPFLRPGGTMDHMTDGLQALLTGTDIARYFIWDGIRGIDYLRSRPDVDKSRIATAGNSGGGTQSAYIAAMDQRVAVAVISCYLNSSKAIWDGPGPQDSEQVFTDFLADHLDFGDFLIAIAPRPALEETATYDFFPIAGARQTRDEAKRIFTLMGAGEKFGYFEYADEHGWSAPRRGAAYNWLSRWLQGRANDDGKDLVEHLNTRADLNATPTGQVLSSYSDALNVQAITAARAERLRAQAKPKSRKQLAIAVRKLLSLPQQAEAPAVDTVGSLDRDGVHIEKINIHSEPGILVPGLVFSPPDSSGHNPAVLYLNPAGMAADAAPGGAIDQLVRQGNVVLAIDPRGWGESAPPLTMDSGYPSTYQLPMRAILTGTSMPAMQTRDVLSAFRYLVSRPDVRPDSISLRATGKATNLGLFAALVEPRIKAVVCDKAPFTYLAMTQEKVGKVDPDVIVPGVLRDFDLPDLEKALGARFRIQPLDAASAAETSSNKK
jgi:cephalosporin-C deacetylase-like acetyl esterase